MRTLLTLLLIFMLACLGCSRTKRLPSGWEESGNPLADTLTLRLEHDYGHNAGNARDRWLAPLESVARADNKNKRIGARVAYWKVRFNLRLGNVQRAKAILDSAMTGLDSARYSDDFHHLKMLRWRFGNNLLSRYLDGIDNLEYFRKAGDSTSVAYVLMDLGDVMQRVGDYGRGKQYCLEASRIWRNIHQEEYADKNLLNVALMSDPAQTDSIHRYLLNHPAYRADSSFYELVLRNHFLNTDSLDYLKRAFKLSENEGRLKSTRAIHLGLYSDWLIRHGQASEALRYALRADSVKNPHQDPQFDMLIAHGLALGYDAKGQTDSAMKYLMRYVTIKDSLNAAQMTVDVANKASRDEINSADLARNMKAEQERMMTFILLLVIVLVFVVISFYLYRVIRNKEMKAIIARKELEYTKARLGREAVIMQEKEMLLKSIQAEIESGESEGVLNSQTSTRLRAVLKLHNSAEEERNTFLEVHDNMLPGFSARLKKAYPELSEKQVRLAAYVCSGMSSAAIGRVLNITPSSVVKNRYRLRQKLKLDPGASLEDFLRTFTE